VFQDYTLFPNLNLYDNAAFAAVDKKEVDVLFELFKIDHLKKRRPHMVSGGERQRCAICQALARHPRLLLLDEPFSALDVITRRGLREELKNLKGKLSCPVIYVTHDINEALFLADEILPVVDGKNDDGWLQRTITREPGSQAVSRGAREPRLSLVY
jgi:molybdate transport system ATP-binding protein